MTANQIAYWANQEQKRSNLAREAETNRSNLIREAETERANKENEYIGWRNALTSKQRMENDEKIGGVNAGANVINSVGKLFGGLIR